MYKDMRILKELVPSSMRSEYIDAIMDAIQIAVEEYFQDYDESLKERLIKSTTHRIEDWEYNAGLENIEGVDLQTRRENVIAYLRGLDTTTPKVIKKVAESYTNSTVKVIEVYKDYYYIVKFINRVGVPPRLDQIRRIIKKINPAHLGFKFEFTYITWGFTKRYGKPASWYKSQECTWGDVREGRFLEDGRIPEEFI